LRTPCERLASALFFFEKQTEKLCVRLTSASRALNIWLRALCERLASALRAPDIMSWRFTSALRALYERSSLYTTALTRALRALHVAPCERPVRRPWRRLVSALRGALRAPSAAPCERFAMHLASSCKLPNASALHFSLRSIVKRTPRFFFNSAKTCFSKYCTFII